MAGFDALLNDPLAQLAYGGLVASAPGGNIQQGFASALGLMQAGEERKQREAQLARQARQDEMQEKLYNLKVMEAGLPDIQYMMTDSGIPIGIDKRTKQAFEVPMGAQVNPPALQNDGQTLDMPPLPGTSQPIVDTSGMSPKTRQFAEQRLVEEQIKQAYPSPQAQEKLRDLEKQAQGKVEMAAETKRLIDEILLDKDAVRAAVGPISSQLPTYRGSTSEAESKIRRLGSIATAENLNLMSGVLSNTDIQILKDIAGGQYDLSRDDEMFIRDLERIQLKLNQSMFNQNSPRPTQGGIIDFNSLPD